MKTLNYEQKEAFEKELLRDFVVHCEKQNIKKSVPNFLNFILRINLLSDRHRFHYLLLKKYKCLMKNGQYKKTDVVFQLADYFGVHENTVWNILKKPLIVNF